MTATATHEYATRSTATRIPDSDPLISADDLATLNEMTPAELTEELTMHDQTARDTASDRAYRAEIVTRLPAA